MAREELRARILEALEAEAPEHGADIVDVQVLGSQRAPVVEVRVDHADEEAPTISLDEVAAQGVWIGEALDALDPISGPYTLEVSSPGMARPLRRERDFERFAGSEVQLKTTASEGRRSFTGTLGGMRDGSVVLVCDDGEHLIPLGEVRSCAIRPDYGI